MMRIAPLPGRPWPLHATSWLLAVAAIVVGAVSAYLARLDGQGTCNVPGVTCPREYTTQGPAIALAVVSVALLVGAVAVCTWRRRR